MAKNWVVTKDQFLTKDEITRLYKSLLDAKDLAIQRGRFHCHIRDYYLFRLLLETGLRVFELVALKVSDFHDGCLIIQNGKGGKRRNILLTKGTQKMIVEFIRVKRRTLGEPTDPTAPLLISKRGRPYTTRGIRKRVKHWFSRLGFNRSLSVHSCRHSYVSHMIAAGVDLVTVRDNAGHSSLAVTSIYSHSVKGDLGDLELFNSNSSTSANKRNN